MRGAGGQRLYTEADIQRLRLLRAVTSAGRSIGSVATVPLEELERLAEADAAARRSAPSGTPAPDAALVVAEAAALVHTLDAAALDARLRRAAALLGMEEFIAHVASPLLERVGNEWHAGTLTPAHEHLASSVLHDIVTETMRSLVPAAGAPRIVVATPGGERHVIGAAAAGAVAALEGWAVVYLGADLPGEDIARAAAESQARIVALSIVHAGAVRGGVRDTLADLRSRLRDEVVLWAGGAAIEPIASELEAVGVKVSTSLAELRAELRRLT